MVTFRPGCEAIADEPSAKVFGYEFAAGFAPKGLLSAINPDFSSAGNNQRCAFLSGIKVTIAVAYRNIGAVTIA